MFTSKLLNGSADILSVIYFILYQHLYDSESKIILKNFILTAYTLEYLFSIQLAINLQNSECKVRRKNESSLSNCVIHINIHCHTSLFSYAKDALLYTLINSSIYSFE